MDNRMGDENSFDVIIVGGSYSGLAAGMALGRALRKVLIIDSGKPCNRQTPHSHNFLTRDGNTPNEIATVARQQVEKYDTVKFLSGLATSGKRIRDGFEIHVVGEPTFTSRKLIFATGIRDIMPSIEGFAECWGISVIHCPYCHGYEVRNEPTGILGNGEYAFEFSSLILNWTKDLTVFTNGESSLSSEQTEKLKGHSVKIVESEITKLSHDSGYLKKIIFKDGTSTYVKALYARSGFEQHCAIPLEIGCELTEEGYIKIDASQKTTVGGVFACGDSTTRMRSVANAVGMGTTAGMMANKEMILEDF
jgi:thioredoxin reductase